MIKSLKIIEYDQIIFIMPADEHHEEWRVRNIPSPEVDTILANTFLRDKVCKDEMDSNIQECINENKVAAGFDTAMEHRLVSPHHLVEVDDEGRVRPSQEVGT